MQRLFTLLEVLDGRLICENIGSCFRTLVRRARSSRTDAFPQRLQASTLTTPLSTTSNWELLCSCGQRSWRSTKQIGRGQQVFDSHAGVAHAIPKLAVMLRT
jgi:hypothetical protein